MLSTQRELPLWISQQVLHYALRGGEGIRSNGHTNTEILLEKSPNFPTQIRIAHVFYGQFEKCLKFNTRFCSHLRNLFSNFLQKIISTMQISELGAILASLNWGQWHLTGINILKMIRYFSSNLPQLVRVSSSYPKTTFYIYLIVVLAPAARPII